MKLSTVGKLVSLTLPLCLFSPFANAQDGDDLPDVIVTADRTPSEESRVGSAVTVLTREELELKGLTFVTDALRQVPGVAVSQLSTQGSSTEVRLRGAESNHTLVLINGIEANDGSTGGIFDFGHLLVADIERIEVIRGPQSALWGSDAIGGVINIITRKSSGDKLGNYALEGGSDKTGYFHLDAGKSLSDANIFFGVSGYDTDGFSQSPSGGERDGYKNLTLDLNADADVTDEFNISGTSRYVTANTEFDGQDFNPMSESFGQVVNTDDETDLDQFYGKLDFKWTPDSGYFDQLASVQLTSTRNDTTGADIDESLFESEKFKALYQANGYLNTGELDHVLTGAFEYEREDYEQRTASFGSSNNQDQKYDTLSYIGQYRLETSYGLNLSGSVRHDDNDEFSDETTFRVAGVYNFDSGFRVHSSYGEGTKTPTFTELFGFFPDSFVGNPNLRTEQSEGWDVGVGMELLDGDLSWDVTYFNTDLEDEIITTFDSDTFVSSVTNLDGESDRQGIEASVNFSVTKSWDMGATYTWVDSDNALGITEVRRPEHSASFNTSYRFMDDKARVNVDVIYVEGQEDFDFSTPTVEQVDLDDYTLVNLSGEYKLLSNLSLYGRVTNLFDNDYQEVLGYNTSGVRGFLGVKGTF